MLRGDAHYVSKESACSLVHVLDEYSGEMRKKKAAMATHTHHSGGVNLECDLYNIL